MKGLERNPSQYSYKSIYQFTIKRDGFNESVQIYAYDIQSATREVMATTDKNDILKAERV
jgi:hypothetical protein